MAASSTTAKHVLDVLLLFDESRPALTAEEIGNLIDAPRSSTYRYIRTLRDRGLLQKTADGGFMLGPRVLQLVQAVRNRQESGDIILPVMRTLSQRTGETILLTRLFDSTPICVERVPGSQKLRISVERGQIQPLHAGASSKVLLAQMPESAWDEYLAPPLARFTEHTPTNPAVLKAQLRLIRQQGYCVSDEEVEPGVRSVAVPLAGEGEQVLALSVVGPLFRMDDQAVAGIRNLLQAAVTAVAEQSLDKLQ